MILAINVNAALDRILFVERFVPNTHMVTHKALECVGGKGMDTSLILNTLGAPLQAISFVAGRNGETLAELVRAKGIATEWISVPGETRVANVIVETALNRHSHITTGGYSLCSEDCDRFLAKLNALALQTDWAVIAGSLPPGAPASFYRTIIEHLHRQGVKVLIDSYGAPVREALAAGPEIVKMNQAEFLSTFAREADTLAQWLKVCREQMTLSAIQTLVITCGKDGILVFTPDATYQAGGLIVEEVNAAGAGDAVSAALVYRLSLGDTWQEALTWAAATSAAVVITEGTAECYMSDIQRLYPAGWVKTLEMVNQ